MAQYATLKAAIDAVIKANGQREITGTVLNQTLNAMVNSLGANYQLAGVATPSTNPGTPDQNVFYLAFEAGTYTNFNATVLSAGISILMWNGSWSSQTFYTIDATPTASSNNLVSSGAVFDAIKTDGSAYDVSAHFPTAGPNNDGKFTLDYILANANTLIPAAWRKGGMSIRFVSSSDNKYVQCRYMGTAVTGTPNPFLNTANWQSVDKEIVPNSQNLPETNAVYKELYGDFYETNIGVTSGTDSLSNKNIYNGEQIAAGTKIEIKVIEAESCLSKFRVVANGTYKTITPKDNGNYANFVDGQVFKITLPLNVTSLGLYEEADYVIGTGTVKLQMAVKSGSIIDKIEKLQAEDIVLQGEIEEIEDDIQDAQSDIENINTDIHGETTDLTISVTSGNQSLSNSNVYNGEQINKGTKIYLKVVKAAGLLSQISIVANGTYNNIIPYTSFVDGQVFDVVLPIDVTKLGLYEESAYVIGTGTVELQLTVTQGAMEDNIAVLQGQVETLNAETVDLESDVDYINDSLFGTPQDRAINVTAGTASTSNKNIYDGSTLKKGTVIHLKVIKAVGLITPFRIVDGAYYTQLSEANFSDGQIFDIILDKDVTKLGLYGEANNIIGTGTVQLSYSIITDSCLVGKINELEESKEDAIFTNHIVVSREAGEGVDFSGLTAISDALDSIADASPNNRYVLHVKGVFRFTDPLTVPMLCGGEYSIILMKDYVDIVGDGPDKTVVIMDFPANATFHDGKVYSDYQPIYFYGSGGKISGVRFIGKNCRYGLHIENDNTHFNKEIELDNCQIEYLGHPDYEGGYGNAVGTGLASGDKWKFTNCIMRALTDYAFAAHTPLSVFDIPPVVTFVNCEFTRPVSFGDYQVENNSFINFVGCRFTNAIPSIRISYAGGSSDAQSADYTRFLLHGSNLKALYTASGFWSGQATKVIRGAALRVVSASTGTASIVSFKIDSSAFDYIIGNSTESALITTKYGWEQQYGYVFRNGGTGISGQAFGTIDLSENSGNVNTKLGKRLGDCSTLNKVLGIYVDGTLYEVTFNRDYTDVSNDDILAEINSVLGNTATADFFSPGSLYYPNINGLSSVICIDENSIKKGMAVVFTVNGMRRAKNTDGYVDGICIEDTANGQYGRVIRGGYIYNYNARNANWVHMIFTAYDNATNTAGITAGISPSEDGMLDINASPKIFRLRQYGSVTYCWEWI